MTDTDIFQILIPIP